VLAEPTFERKAASTPESGNSPPCGRVWSRLILLIQEPMPFPVTRRERMILMVIALLVVLGLLGMAIL